MMQTSVLHEKREALVNIANISSTSRKTNKSQLKRESTYRMRDHAQRCLVDANIKKRDGKGSHRTCKCGKRRAKNGEQPTIKLSKNHVESQSAIGNVQTCGSVWSCPVCYETKALEEGQKILKAIEALKEQGYIPMMIALTASHSVEMSLEYSERTFKEAWRIFNGHRQWRNFKEKFHVHHKITNVDITWSADNGWHYHKHLLLFLDATKIDDISEAFLAADKLTAVWQSQLKNQGRSGTKAHALHVSERGKSATDYIAKIGITVQDNGKLHYEMTSTNTKDSYTVWDMLKHSESGNKQARKLYLEYVRVMSGKNWVQFGKTGLQDIIEEYEPDNGEEQEPETMQNWLKLSDYWFDILRRSDNGLSRIITVAARTRSIEDVRECLFDLKSELVEQNRLSDYYRLYHPIENSIADIRIHEDWNNEKLSSDSMPDNDTG